MNPDPRIRGGEGHGRIDQPAGNQVGSLGGKKLEVSPGLHTPKASTWSSIIDFVSTPLHALRKAMSSKPYSGLTFGKLFSGEGEHAVLNRTNIGPTLEDLGKSLCHGADDDGRNMFYKDSWGVDYHLRDEFLSKKDGLVYLGRFRQAIEEELYGTEDKKGLLQQYNEAVESFEQNPTVYGPALKKLEAQIAGAKILLRSHENIIARELFWNVGDEDIFENIPLGNLLKVLPEGSKHHGLLEFYLDDNPGAAEEPATEKLMEDILGKCTPSNNWAFRGADLLKAMPDEAIAKILYSKPPYEGQRLLLALPGKRLEGIEKAFVKCCLKDPSGEYRDPLVLAETILARTPIDLLCQEPEKTLLGNIAEGIEVQEPVDKEKLEAAREAFDAAKQKHEETQLALRDAKAHNSAVMKRGADRAALGMIESKLKMQESDVARIRKKDDEIQEEYKTKSNELAALKIQEGADAKEIKRFERQLDKLKTTVDKVRAQRIEIEHALESDNKRAEVYREAIAQAPEGEKKDTAALETAVREAQETMEAARAELNQLEAQSQVGLAYQDLLLPTVLNLALTLPPDKARTFVDRLNMNPDIHLGNDVIEDLFVLLDQREETQKLLKEEAERMHRLEVETLDYHSIALGNGKVLTDKNVVSTMRAFVTSNKVDLDIPPSGDRRLAENIGKHASGSVKVLLDMQYAVDRHIEAVNHKLFLCEQAIAAEKEFGGSPSQSLEALHQRYREEAYGLQILRKSIHHNAAQVISGPSATLRGLEEVELKSLADRLARNEGFKRSPECYLQIIAGIRGVSFAQELVEELTGFDAYGDLNYSNLVGPAHTGLSSKIRHALDGMSEDVAAAVAEAPEVHLDDAIGDLGLNLGKKHGLNSESIAYEMRRIGKKDMSVDAIKGLLEKQLDEDNAIVAYSKVAGYRASLEGFIAQLEGIAEEEGSKEIQQAINGYKLELDGAKRLEAALREIAFPITTEEILEEFVILDVDGVDQPLVHQEEALNEEENTNVVGEDIIIEGVNIDAIKEDSVIEGVLPIKLFGKDLSLLNDEQLIAKLCAFVSVGDISLLPSDKSSIEYALPEGMSIHEALGAIITKQEKLQEELNSIQTGGNIKYGHVDGQKTDPRFANTHKSREDRIRSQRLNQAIQGLKMVRKRIESDIIADGVKYPDGIQFNGDDINNTNADAMHTAIRAKYQELPQGTEPTFANLGITFADDAEHTALQQLQADLALCLWNGNHALNNAWDDYSVSEEEVTEMAKSYSGLTILHKAVINEMRELNLDPAGEFFDIWDYKEPDVHVIDARFGG